MYILIYNHVICAGSGQFEVSNTQFRNYTFESRILDFRALSRVSKTQYSDGATSRVSSSVSHYHGGSDSHSTHAVDWMPGRSSARKGWPAKCTCFNRSSCAAGRGILKMMDLISFPSNRDQGGWCSFGSNERDYLGCVSRTTISLSRWSRGSRQQSQTATAGCRRALNLLR